MPVHGITRRQYPLTDLGVSPSVLLPPLAALLIVCAAPTIRADQPPAATLDPRPIPGATRLDGLVILWLPKDFDPGLTERLKTALLRHGADLTTANADADLAEGLRRGHVVALGNACNNAAIRRLYLEFFDWTDAAWPSPGGFAITTLVDPYALGHDIVRVGYSDDAGAESAVNAFIARLDALDPAEPMPYLHDVKLGSLSPVYHHYLDPLLSPDFRWRNDDNTWDLQVQVAHLGIAYLLTGDDVFLPPFRRRFMHYLEVNKAKHWLSSHGFMRHMTLPYLLTEHHPVWTPDDRRFVLDSIRDLLASEDGINYPGIAQETASGLPRGNHAVRAALDCFIHARYLDLHYHLAEARDALQKLDSYFRWQFTCAKPWEDSNGHQLKASMIGVAAYALALGDRTMIDSGTLRRAAERAEMQVNNLGVGALFSGPGAAGFTPVTMLAMAAFTHDDPAFYRTLRSIDLEPKPMPDPLLAALALPYRHGDEFLRAFALPAAESPANVPDNANTFAVAGFDDAYRAAQPDVPARGFDKIAFRGGWSRTDEYLLLDGMSRGLHAFENAHCVLEMCALGRRWLCAVDWGDRNASVRNQNGLQVLIDGLAPSDTPVFAELLATAESADLQACVTQLASREQGSTWRRWIVHQKGKFFVVFDDVSLDARPNADLAVIQSRWFLHGRITRDGNTLIARQGVVGDETWLAAVPLDASRLTLDLIDVSRSYRGFREYCGKWLFQDIPTRIDFPIDPEATPATITKATLSRAFSAATPFRLIGGMLFSWGTGDPRPPLVKPEGEAFTLTDSHGESLHVRFNAAGMTIETSHGELRLDLPRAEQPAPPIEAPTMIPTFDHETDRTTERFTRVSLDVEGTPLALQESPAGFVMSTNTGDLFCITDTGLINWHERLGAPARQLALWRSGDQLRIIAGDDAGRVTALTPDGHIVWQTKLPYSEKVYDIAWAYPASMVRDLEVADLDGDAEPEIFAGVTDSHLYCLDAKGSIRWTRGAEWGTPTVIRVFDLDHNGQSEALFGTGDPSVMGGAMVCDLKGRKGSGPLPWRLGVGDIASFIQPASLTALLPITIGDTPCLILGTDSDAGQVRCIELNNAERWRLNVGARPLGIWSASDAGGDQPVYLAVLDSGYVFTFDESGTLLTRRTTGDALHAAVRSDDGCLLLAGEKLFVIEGDGDPEAVWASPPLEHPKICPANAGPRPAAAVSAAGRVVLLLPAL